jgi:hypothetical protein
MTAVNFWGVGGGIELVQTLRSIAANGGMIGEGPKYKAISEFVATLSTLVFDDTSVTAQKRLTNSAQEFFTPDGFH